MAKEIERRFMPVAKDRAQITQITIAMLSQELLEHEHKGITQGYFEIPDPSKSFRVRLFTDERTAFLTIKGGKGLVREELEKEMSTPDEPVELPTLLKHLFGEVKEVTDSLTNLHLARLATDLRGLDVPAMPFISERLLSSIPCVAITGGPCSGKSSIMKILQTEFPDVHFVPEVASIIIGQVGILPDNDPIQNRVFQKAVYRVGKIFRTTSTEFAIAQNKKVIVLDRGEADGAAYFEGGIKEFEKVIGTTMTAEYGNIAMVICLEVPSKEIFEKKKANNPARSETHEEAVALGKRTKTAWALHPNFHLVGNDGGWDAKINMVRNLILSAIKK